MNTFVVVITNGLFRLLCDRLMVFVMGSQEMTFLVGMISLTWSRILLAKQMKLLEI